MRTMKQVLAVLLIATTAFIAGCAGTSSDTQVKETAKPKNTVTIQVYEPNKTATYLVGKPVEVTVSDKPEQDIMNAILEQWKKDKLPLLSETAEINRIDVKDGVATVDIKKESLKGMSGGSTTEQLAVASIVNTLTDDKTIQEVQFLLDGKKVETLNGHVDISKPLKRMDQYLKQK